METQPVLEGGYRGSKLTANQLQVWLAQKLVPEVPLYNLAVALHLNGPIDTAAFRKAFSVLVASSDALRTTFEEADGIPQQRVLTRVSFSIDIVDFSHVPDGSALARNWMAKRCQAPIDWRGRLFDSALLRISENRWIWYLAVHHLICDSWSFELIYRSMAILYHAGCEGRSPEKIELPPFADYVAHEQEYRDSPKYQKTDKYWRDFLSETHGRVDLYGRISETMTTRVRRVSQDLGDYRTRKLKEVAKELGGGTSDAALVDIFAALLICYLDCLTGDRSYTVGVPFHNRRSAAFKKTVGFFSEVLPIRVGIDDGETFCSLAAKFSREVRRTLRYGKYAVTNPLFRRVYDVSLNYHTRSFCDFAGIPARPEWIHSGHGDESLAIQVHDFGSSENVVIDFDLHDGVFDERDHERVPVHYLRVLDEFLDDPHKPLHRLSLVTDHEARRLLEQFAPASESRTANSVDELFRRKVKEQPDHPAVVGDDECLTYSELNSRAASIAALLRAQGIQREGLVVLYLTRSSALIAAILGVMKAGAAYVPVDPNYSSEWLRLILEDAVAPVLLTERSLLSSLPHTKVKVICVDEQADCPQESADTPSPPAFKDALAYVIQTSGSSGRPKGVAVTHGALSNFAESAARSFELTSADRVLQFASISFDTSAEEIFPTLIAGATLILQRDAFPSNAVQFLDRCRKLNVTVLDLPTAYWHEFVVGLFAERHLISSPIRLVIIGGERAIPERLALWQAFVVEGVRLVNTYGPSETTVAATFADLTNEPAECGGSAEVAIGQPFANIQALVLDRNLNPAPMGVPGELYVGGAGLARGYLGLPDLTAERFVPSPFRNESGARLYRTGDMARYREDGNIEFLRRRDDQVKIRGFRVEPEGIAVVLRQHPLVRDAAVLPNGNSGSIRLVAVVVPEGAGVLNPAEVQNFVRARLPDYMVPAVVLAVESLPLTNRGKVDRDALKILSNGQCAAAKDLEPPQTSTEERIAQQWRELLCVEAIGRDQHFFEIGGHSLLAARAVLRIGQEFGLDIPLRTIFEAPTIASFAERIENGLSLREQVAAPSPVAIRSYNGHAPASDSQSRIWYMDQLAPESTAYNITTAIRFTGTLDRTALGKSVDLLIERHESLRTTIENSSGEPVQVIAVSLHVDIPEIDLTTSAAEDRIGLAKKILRDEGRRPFDLAHGPLLRLMLLKLDERDYILLLSMHHVISDQWSLGVIAREISSSYNGFRSGTPAALEPPRAQYGDFSVWQSHRLSLERLQADFNYWKGQLDEVQPASVPTDRPRPVVQTFNGSHRTLSLSQELIGKLRRLAVSENASLYMVFLAAFKILLSRYSGREDVAIGSPVANRTRAEWEEVIGTFINILVLRTDLSDSPSLRDIIRRVRAVVLDAFSHGEMPFHKLVEELAPGRDASRSPLVQVLFNFQSAPAENLNFEDISWAPFEFEQWASQFDIGVTVDPEITRKIFISYNTDLYDESTIRRFLQHYGMVLESIAADAEQSINTIATRIGGPERQEHENDLAYSEVCFHSLFEAQAARTPDAVALVYEDRHLTYGELNTRAECLARRLRSLGVGPEVLVGICADRSLELVSGLLAVAKAGGTYVPIDPAYPADRVAFILEDSGIAALISQTHLLQQLPQNDLPVLCLDQPLESKGEVDDKAGPPARPDQLAYVIYTSGSTGQPKGVQVSHRSLVSFLHSMKERPGIAPSDVLLSVTTISFDIAALELFLPLIYGARVVVASRETAADGEAIVRQLKLCGATIMQATPTTWRLMIEAGWQGSRDFKVICGGEALPTDLAKELTLRSDSVWNLYGPTETTVWSSIWPVKADSHVVIGQPIHNTQIYILDKNLLPLPTGVEGEVYIGGEGLARGYLHRPELTAEKFTPNPLGSSSRLYRTGDWGRYLADGNIEYIGRIDNQIKMRGFRIELGEIEAVLSAHADVKQVVVAVRGEATDKRLVAYIVPRDGVTLNDGDLANHTKGKVPAYMVPGQFLVLSKLPLTPNGKIDRSALPMPEMSTRASASGPRSRLEYEVSNIWKGFLRVGGIGVDENFFDLGGNSLLAARLIAAIEGHFGKRIRLAEFFASPTVSHVAGLLRREGYSSQWTSLVPLQPGGSKPPFFWIQGLSTNVRLPGYLGEDQPVYALLPESQDGKQALYPDLEQLAAHYLEELRSVQPAGPYFIGGYSFGGLVVFEVAQQLRRLGHEVALVVMLDGTAPMRNARSAGRGGLRFEAAIARVVGCTAARAIARLHEHVTAVSDWSGYVSLVAQAGARLAQPLRWRHLVKTAKRVIYQYCVSAGRDIPICCRTIYIADVHSKARRNYQAINYPGPVVYFQAVNNPDDPLSHWRDFFAGELDVYPITGNHQTIAHEPQLKAWAEQLSECLIKAQAAHSLSRKNEQPETVHSSASMALSI